MPSLFLSGMDANAQKAKQLFSTDERFLVPAYQRPYVWEEDAQWRPLWEDIERLAQSRLENKNDSHFLGTIVLKQERTAPGSVSEWSVIDGQQRLTTLQIIFSALALSAKENNLDDLARRLRSFILLEDFKASGDERFRFWPTDVNREAYKNVMSEDGPDLSSDDRENTVEEAWVFFKNTIDQYVEDFLEEEETLRDYYGALHDTLVGMVEIVTIQINEEEKPQVVFETLNARGTPLLATDLIKNALLEKAAQEDLDIDQIYKEYWKPGLGDNDYWSKEEAFINYSAPRSEVFLMQWLALKTGKPASSDAIFDRFRRLFLDSEEAPPLLKLLKELKEDALLSRNLDSLSADSPEGKLIQRMHSLGSVAFMPLVLLLLKLDLSAEQKARAFGALESFIMRRALSRLQTGNYGNLSAEIITAINKDPLKADETLISKLISSQASSSRWPSDSQLIPLLSEQPVYGVLGRKRIFDLLSQIELERRSSAYSENISALPSKLHIEHLMPQRWQTFWPLGVKSEEEREGCIHLLGNLTLISGTLNISISNSAWDKKKTEFVKNSVLLINRDLPDKWDEEAIKKRSRQLAGEALAIWPGPEAFLPEGWKLDEIEPEDVEDSPLEIGRLYLEAPEKMSLLLFDLASHPEERRTYKEIEESLSWPRGTVAGVFGAYSRHNSGKRPFSINLELSGEWSMWMSQDAAKAVLTLEEKKKKESYLKMEAAIEDPEVLELLRSLDDITKEKGFSFGLDPFVLYKSGASVCRGYFAKKWMFIFWQGDKQAEETLKSRLSKPEEVVLSGNKLRLHLASREEFREFLDIVNE